MTGGAGNRVHSAGYTGKLSTFQDPLSSPSRGGNRVMERTFFAPHEMASPGQEVESRQGRQAHARGLSSPHYHFSGSGVGSDSTLHRCLGSCWSLLAAPSVAPQGLPGMAGSSARFQAAVASSLIALLHGAGSQGCRAGGPGSGLCGRLREGARTPPPQGQPLIHSHLGSSCTGQESSVPPEPGAWQGDADSPVEKASEDRD